MRDPRICPAGTVARLAAGLFCSFTLVMGVSALPAYAETTVELRQKANAARDELNQLFLEVEEANEELSIAKTELEELEKTIEESQEKVDKATEELEEAQDSLSSFLASDYKNGTSTFLSVVLGSSSFDEFTSNVYYANRLSERRSAEIEVVAELKKQLDAEHVKLQENKDSQAQKVEQLDEQAKVAQEKTDAMQAYIDALDEEVKNRIDEERAEAVRVAQERGLDFENEYNIALAQIKAQRTALGVSEDEVINGITDEQRATILASGRAAIGTPYVLGDSTPGVSIDCSGLTSYAYRQAGLSIPRTSTQQRLASTVKDISEAFAGDLVFWNGHVALYAGNNTIVHANYSGVEEIPLYDGYLGAGNPFA